MLKVPGLVLESLLLFAPGTAIGATIISTFGPGDSYSPCCGFGNVAPAQMAYPFTIPSGPNFTFTGAELALSEGIGSTNAVDISLAADASDQPGTLLETFHLVNALGPAGANNPLGPRWMGLSVSILCERWKVAAGVSAAPTARLNSLASSRRRLNPV